MKLSKKPYWCTFPAGSIPVRGPLKYHHSITVAGCGLSSRGREMAAVAACAASIDTSAGVARATRRSGASHLTFEEPARDLMGCAPSIFILLKIFNIVTATKHRIKRQEEANRSALHAPEEAAFQRDRHGQLAVAVLVEQYGDLVAVVPLHRALAPALAHDACAYREWDLSWRSLGLPEVVVAVPAGAGVVLPEIGQEERSTAA